MLDPDDLIAAVQRAGCNRLRWPDLASVAARLDRSKFLTDGVLDETKVAAWCDAVLPARSGPDWPTVERLVADGGKRVTIFAEPEITAEGVTSTVSEATLIHLDRSDLVAGYPPDPDRHQPRSTR